jgi:hypothetical protein
LWRIVRCFGLRGTKKMKNWFVMALLVQLLGQLLGQTCQADQFIKWQGYEIHYTTLSSRLIPADVAASHGITRSDNRIVTNVSIRRDGLPIKATIRGTATNLLNKFWRLQRSWNKTRSIIWPTS